MKHVKEGVDCVVFVLGMGVLCLTAFSLYSGETNNKGNTISIEAKAAINLPIVRELRDCADMLALQEQMPPERHAEDAIHRQFKRWLTIQESYEEYLRQYPIELKPVERWESLVVSEHAEAISMFHPETLTEDLDFAEQMKEKENLIFMVSLLDRCYRNLGWNAFLKENLSEKQQETFSSLFQPKKEQSNKVESILKSVEQKLSEELGKLAARRASVAVLLGRQLDVKGGAFPEDTVFKLLENPGYQHQTLRWLVLSGEKVPPKILAKIGEIALDDSLDFGIRAVGIRTFGLLGDDRSVLETLKKQFRQSPQISSPSPKMHFFHTFMQSRLIFELRTISDSERAPYLVRELYSTAEFRGGGIRYVMPIAKAFFPLEFAEKVLKRLDRKNDEITPYRYQAALAHPIEELAAREKVTEELGSDLINYLEKLPARKLRPVIDALGATNDFDRFGLPMIQCYKRYKDKETEEATVIKNGIAFQLMVMTREEMEITDLLRHLSSQSDYNDYQQTIEDIISKIREIRQKTGAGLRGRP